MANGYLFYWNNVISIFTNGKFEGWGRKRTGRFASWCHNVFGGELKLLEDGFIRSVGLGVGGSPSFSTVEDDTGIYYDATRSSTLENILNTYDFSSDDELMVKASEAIELIKKYHISKYNDSPDIDNSLINKYRMAHGQIHDKKVLVIAQTSGDMSLKYGLAEKFDTDEMIQAAVDENPDAAIYLKIHPDVLSGKKKSDIDIKKAKQSCIVIEENVNPISLLKYFSKVYTKTSQMGFEALLLGKECVCFGMPFYAGWGVTDDRVTCERRQRTLGSDEIFAAAYILYTHYNSPYGNRLSTIIETIKELAELKKVQRLQENVKGYFFGFSRWKHAFVKPFFNELKEGHQIFVNPLPGGKHLDLALKKGLDKKSRIYIWGRKPFEEVEQYAKEHDLELFRVEDGFIRSIGLGSDLTQPYSLVVDSRGIYFDPAQESALESILQNYDFAADSRLLERAKNVRTYLIEKKLSKYNLYDEVVLNLPKNKRIIVVPGQVEDDASMRYGAKDMDNLTLLREVRECRPEEYIIFKPHPDVLAGNRVGHIEECEALKYCNKIVTEVSLDSVLMYADEVHTMTSLVGFEALVRGIEVHTYGIPFYAGWGLSTDKRICKRRTRGLELDELIAGVLLLYPRYIDPQSKKLCTIEILLESLEAERQHYALSKYYRISIKVRNFISRKSQLLISFIKSF